MQVTDLDKERMKRFVLKLAASLDNVLGPKAAAREKMVNAMISCNIPPHDLANSTIEALFIVLSDGHGMKNDDIADMLGHDIGYTAMIRNRSNNT